MLTSTCLAPIPVADAATRPSQRCPRSHLALGRPRPTTLAAPAHDAALLIGPRPWPRVLATPATREVRLAPALSVPSRGKRPPGLGARWAVFNLPDTLRRLPPTDFPSVRHATTTRPFRGTWPNTFDRRQFFPCPAQLPHCPSAASEADTTGPRVSLGRGPLARFSRPTGGHPPLPRYLPASCRLLPQRPPRPGP